jgi:cobalt/nickel transport protein
MGNRIKYFVVMLVAVTIVGSGIVGIASAHFTMLFPGEDKVVSPEDYIASLGDEKTMLITWGCPFKELFDCIDVPEVYVRAPDGIVTQLTPVETSVDGVKAYKASFTVDKRGDYIVSATMNVSAIKGNFSDHAKAVIHCGQAIWKGWDAELGDKVEIIPYIRPYGLEEGFVFRARALQDGEPLANTTVFVVKYRLGDDPEVLKKAEAIYPQDSWMMVKGQAKTDADGNFVYTLDEPGVWTIAAFGKGVMERSILIVPVFESFPPTEAGGGTSASPKTETTPESPAVGLVATVVVIGLIAVLLRRKRSGGVR